MKGPKDRPKKGSSADRAAAWASATRKNGEGQDVPATPRRMWPSSLRRRNKYRPGTRAPNIHEAERAALARANAPAQVPK